jgi:tetratricopeptide (TPR) repeat protein
LIRWNDYGIGLFLQGDLKAADQVFLRVTEIDPSYVDGWVNIGRVRVREGRPAEAAEVLEKALMLQPELARAHFFMGTVLKTRGNYDEAIAHFRKAESQYPRDRVVLNQIGRLYFLKREFRQAIELFHRVLKIDPEDLQAHYNLMLCWRALGDQEKAQREQALYLRFKADESAQSIAGLHVRKDPYDNNERQAIHEHRSFPLTQIDRESSIANAVKEKSQASLRY